MGKTKKLIGLSEIILMAVSVIFIVGQIWLDLTMPEYMSKITKLVKTQGSTMREILSAGSIMLACALGSAIFSVVVGYCTARLSAGVTKTLREKIYVKVSQFGESEIKKFSTASLITRTTNDVRQVAMLIAFGFQVSIKAPIMGVWAVLKILGKGWQWSVATGIAVAVMMIGFLFITFFVVPKFKIIQTKTDSLNRITRENLIGIRVIRAFNAENYQQEKFGEVNSDLTKTHLFVQRTMGLLSPVMSLVMNALALSIYIIGAILITNAIGLDKLTLFGNMMVFYSYAMQVVMSFMMLAVVSFIIPRAIVSIKRIKEVLNTNSEVTEGEFSGETEEKGTIEFKNVSFKYPDASEKVLDSINFKVNNGETLAIIGATASGKSTLINLIPRFYDATEGEILIDGINVKDYKFEKLFSKIGYISQKATLFSGTIKSNISMGEINGHKSSDENQDLALEIARAKEILGEKENGIDSVVEQGGTNFSGGQKQRLSIARAIARKPEILIFDDSFSALDYKTDKMLRDKIKTDLKGTTCVIVAQRIGTIKNADKIVVLKDGKIVGIGKHEDLLNNCEEYKCIALSQLNEEELYGKKQ